MNKRIILRIIILIAFIALITYLLIHHDIYKLFVDKQRIITFIKSFHPYDEIVFILLQILQVVAAPMPGELTGLIGGYLYGPLLGTIYSTIGLTIGSWLAFLLTRFFGLPLVEKTVRSSIIQKYDYFLEHRGLLVSFLLFLIPGFPKDYLCYIIGLSHMKTLHFLTISTVGRLLGTIILSVCGSYAYNHQYVRLLGIIIISCIFVIIAYFYRDKWLEMVKNK